MNLKASVETEINNFFKSLFVTIKEWIFTFSLLMILGLIMMTFEPRDGIININNSYEKYPYTGETVPFIPLFIIAVFIPPIFIFIFALTSPKTIDLNFAGLSFLQTLSITLFITETLKVFVSRHRPNFFSYCKYDFEAGRCTAKPLHIRDSKMSFPSGHASISFSSSVWIFLFIGKIIQNKEEIWWLLVRFIPISIAIFISATRITDYMHFPSDVACGAMLGSGVAIIIFSSQINRIFAKKQDNDMMSLL